MNIRISLLAVLMALVFAGCCPHHGAQTSHHHEDCPKQCRYCPGH